MNSKLCPRVLTVLHACTWFDSNSRLSTRTHYYYKLKKKIKFIEKLIFTSGLSKSLIRPYL